jgi:hypothetical protein
MPLFPRKRSKKPQVQGSSGAITRSLQANSQLGTTYQSGQTALAQIPRPQLNSEQGSSAPIRIIEVVPDLASNYQRTLTYSKMRNDAGVDASLRVIKTPILGADFYMEPYSSDPADVLIAQFVWDNLSKGLNAPLITALEDILTMFDEGYSVLEKVYEQRPWSQNAKGANSKTYTMLKKLAIRPPSTISLIEYDNNGGPKKVTQQAIQADGSTKEAALDISKLIIFTFGKQGGDIRGKALDPDTTIVTPSGNKRLDDLQVGDQIYDEKGKIRHVVAKQEWANRPLYDITFSTGETIRADANHEWVVRWGTRLSRIVPTTEQMYELHHSDARGNKYMSIERAETLQYPESYQLVDPWIMGQWLGDGTSNTGEITTGDYEDLVWECHQAGYDTQMAAGSRQQGVARKVLVKDLAFKLRAMGLKNNKFVPDCYVRASKEQRIAFVQGLMDSDGYISKFGYCEFSNTNPDIVQAMEKVVRSLGIRVTTQYVVPPSRQVVMGQMCNIKPYWRVKFTPNFRAFRFNRKLVTQQTADKNRKFTHNKFISVKDIQPAGSGRSICIETDAPSHLFLAGETLVPTHNSVLRTAYQHWYYKNHLYKIDAIQKERHAIGVPRGTLGPGATEQDKVNLIKMLRNLRTNEESFIMQTTNVTVDFAELQHSPVDVLASADHHNQMIMLNVLAQFLLGASGAGRASSASGQDIFMKALRHVANSIAQSCNMFLVPELVVWNFPTTNFPQLKVRNIGETRDLQLFSSALSNLFAQSAITSDPITENWLREVFDMPSKDVTAPRGIPTREQIRVTDQAAGGGTEGTAGQTSGSAAATPAATTNGAQRGAVKAGAIKSGNVGKGTNPPTT